MPSYSEFSMYIAAHEDDWQLFMGVNAYNDIHNSSGKVLFIFTTAGDATSGNTYYQARENGARSSIKFAADAASSSPATPVSGTRTFNGRSIAYWQYKNTVSYFLRLPDGFPDGSRTGSLQQLYERRVPRTTALDGSATYEGWQSLVTTLDQLIRFELGGISVLWLNTADTDRARNPNDHSDHYHSTLAAQQAVASLRCNMALYVDYASSGMTPNVSTAELIDKSGTLAAYTKVMDDAGFTDRDSWDDGHVAWLSRNYFRTVTV
ncbi:MAG TPA: hypothetical protein VFZ09_05215 [Archangium sp.]|uniref:hypothetical protein n=1 Tax=Archangium sp. TaxID=1872627 RepID=UPI002E3760E1|nr:hypothetical protein [Archangium sp.]HEX5745621.1 hypothetical protein [Archangium sp.]